MISLARTSRTAGRLLALLACTSLPFTAFGVEPTPTAKTAGGIISGNLSAPGGGVVEYPLIFLFDAAGPENQPVDLTQPNTDGDYLFKGLDTGDYKVAFTGRQGLLSYYEFYDDVPQGQFDQATVVAVVDGQTTSGIDGVIGQAPGGFVEGVVTDLYGRGFDYGFVTAYVFEGGQWVESEFQTELIYYDGDYSFPLPAGTYRFLIEAGSFLAPGEALVSEFWPDAATVGAAQDIVVSLDQTITGVDATLGENATGSIAGTVTNGGSPVSGVEVRVFDRSLGEQFDSLEVTGPSGQFLLEGLWPEEYFVEVFDPLGRYEPTYFGGTGQGGQPVTRIPVAQGAAVTGADISLAADDPATPNGSISGVVTDSTGAPLRGARISGLVEVCTPGASCDTEQFSTRATDTGFYRLRRLVPGDYIIRFGDATGDGLREFYDDQPTAEDADPVTVVGSAVNGIDAQLSLGGSLAGTVLDTDGEPFELLTVAAWQQVAGNWVQIASVFEFDGDGSWRLSSLPPGDYVLGFTGRVSITSTSGLVEFYDDEFSLDTADPVTVTAGQTLSGLDAVLGNAAPGGFAGRVTDTGGAPIVEATVRVLDSRLIDPVGVATTDVNGDYEITGLVPGTYYLSFVDSNGNREWWNDVDTSEWATPLEIATTLRTGFDAELGATAGGPGGGTILGTVVDEATQTPIADVLMICLSADFVPVPSCRTTTASDGTYTLGGNLPTGDYVVLAAPETGFVREYYEDAIFLEGADVIAVTLGAATTGIDLELDVPATISGTVTPASGSFDRILVDGLVQDATGAWRFIARAEADDNGDYTLEGLAAGTYRVRFLGVSQGAPTVVEVYDNQATVENGDDLAVVAGGSVTGIDAVLGDLSPLVNPSFDGTLDAWTLTTPSAEATSITHDAADRFGGDVSGSARFSHDGSIGETLSLSQCVAVEGDGDYAVGAYARIEGGGPFDPTIGLLVESFASGDCTGGPTSSEFVAEMAGTESEPGDDWTLLAGERMLEGAGSVLLTVVVDAGSASSFEAWVDDVYLMRAGQVFGDGFESGAVGAWSAAVGTP